jgi:ankyrin repeat protein
MLRREIQPMTKEMEKAALNGDELMVRALLDKGESINCYDNSSKSSLLMWTCAWGFTDLAGSLINQGADFQEHCSIEGSTALMYSSFHGRVDIVELLLEKGANPNYRDISRYTAMDKAALTKNWKILRLLMNSGGRYDSLVPIDINWEQVMPVDPEIQETENAIDQWLLKWEAYSSVNDNE